MSVGDGQADPPKDLDERTAAGHETISPAPLSLGSFAERLAPLLGGARKLALGVSGGSDSMALLHLAARVRAPLDLDLAAITVEHGVRRESAAEAQVVADAAAALGVPHQILSWDGPGETGNLQAEARRARYDLMRAWRAEAGIDVLAVAHTEDDVAETFLLRLARGSGVDGLARMAARAEDGRVEEGPRAGRPLWLIRPLLDVSRARLRAACQAFGAAWIDDPSNADPRFDRAKARRLLDLAEPLGLSRGRLAKTAAGMARARAALETATEALMASAVAWSPEIGEARLSVALLREAPREIGLRALARTLEAVAGATYPPRLEPLSAAFDALSEETSAGRTLHGCALAPERMRERWRIAREPAACADPAALPPRRWTRWDGRFDVWWTPDDASADPALIIGAAGEDGVAAVRAAEAEGRRAPPSAWSNASPAARRAACAVRVEDTVVALPAAGWTRRDIHIQPVRRLATMDNPSAIVS